MKLSELVPRLPSEYVKIGTENGCGWVYAGSVAGYLGNPDAVDAGCIDVLKASVKWGESRRRNAPTSEQYMRYFRYVQTQQTKIKKYQRLMEREVIEYKRASPIVDDVDSPVWWVIIKGDDNGKFDCIGEDGKGITTIDNSKRKPKRK